MIRPFCICLLLSFCFQCLSQAPENKSEVPIGIFIGDTLIKFENFEVSINRENVAASIPHYHIKGKFTIDSMCLVNSIQLIYVTLDSMYWEEPQSWFVDKFGSGQLTICCWSSDFRNIDHILQDNSCLDCSLRSVRPALFVGHGEDYIRVKNKQTHQKENIPFDKILGVLMYIDDQDIRKLQVIH